jgi:xylulokinase
MSYLGIDIGTSSSKALVVNEIGKIIAFEKIVHNYISPEGDWIELDPNLIFYNVKKIISSLAQRVKKKDPIRALSFSSLGTAFVPVDRKTNILYNAISSLDSRAKSKLNYFEEIGFDNYEIYKITGQPKQVISLLHNILWLREKLNKNFNKVYKFLSLKDFFLFKIGLKPITDYTQASRTMLYDFKKKEWSDKIFDYLVLDKAIMPEIVNSYTVLTDSLEEKICSELELNKKVIVTAGAHDSECCALGANLYYPDDLAITLGTYEVLTNISNAFITSRNKFKNNIYIEEHVIENKYVNYSLFYSGLILEWVKNIFFENKNNNFSKILNKLSSNISQTFTIPYLKGSGAPLFNESKKAIISGITIHSDKYDIIKSIIEGSNFCVRTIINCLKNKKIDNIFVLGGGAQSDFLLQNKANILNNEIKALEILECGAYGASIIAYYADKKETDFIELFKIFKNRVKKIYYPQREIVEAYLQKFNQLEKLIKVNNFLGIQGM